MGLDASAAASMTSIYLFGVLSQHNRWLSVRQATIAGNIANASTPGFKALDVTAFEAALDSAKLAMATTRSGHVTSSGTDAPATDVRQEEPWEVTHAGNSVSLEQELLKAGDVNRAYRLNTSVLKAFHRMLMTSAKV